MTQKLYYDALYQKEFNADIVRQDIQNGKAHVVLDKTLFYPGGGGQPCDFGTLNGYPVEDVYEQNGEIFHVLANLLPNGTVRGVIDWQRRFELMQQHLGQHILSAILVRDYSLNTIGMRLERDSLSIDLDGFVKDQKVALAEAAANEIIYQNIPVEVLFPTMEEIRQNSKRPIPETDERIRIVKIGELDFTPCCGLQNKSTGEVGVIKVQSHGVHKSGTRIHFLCGRPAMRWISELYKSNSRLQSELGCAEHEIVDRVCKQRDEFQAAKAKNQALMKRLIVADAQQLIASAPEFSEIAIVEHILPDTSQDEMKMLYAELTKDKGVIALLGGITSDGAYLMFGCHKAEKRIDVRDAFKTAILMIEGKGGGGACYAQGFGTKTVEVSNAVDAAFEILKNKLKENEAL